MLSRLAGRRPAWLRRGASPKDALEPDNGWILVCRAVFYPLTAALGRRRFSGQEHLPRTGPALVVGNHVSHLDPVYDAVYVRKAGRWPHFMAKTSIWKVPGVGVLMTGTRQIPVERSGGAGQLSLDAAVQALQGDKVVVIYPEGTITRDPGGWPMKPKAGVALLALAGEFPVIPMVNWGTQRVFVPYVKKGRFAPLPRKDIVVKLGPPVDMSPFRGQEVDARLIRDVSIAIMTAVRDLVAAERGETPPTTFFVPRKAADAGSSGSTSGRTSKPVSGGSTEKPAPDTTDDGAGSVT